MTTPKRLTRRAAYRGQPVQVTTRTGDTTNLTLSGWGPYVLRGWTEDGTWREFATGAVQTVTAR